MAASYSAIRSAVVALIESADPDIGQVHNRQRWAKNWGEFLDLFKYTPTDGDVEVIRGWMVSRAAIPVEDTHSAFGAFYRAHSIVIRGIMGFSDSGDSDGDFNAYIDKVIEAIDHDADLGGASNVGEGPGPCNTRVIELRQFGPVLCHYAEIDFTVPRQGD